LLIWAPVLVTVLVVRFILDLMTRRCCPPHALRPDVLLGRHVLGLGHCCAPDRAPDRPAGDDFVGRALVAIGGRPARARPFVRALYSGVKSFSETVFQNSGVHSRRCCCGISARRPVEHGLPDHDTWTRSTSGWRAAGVRVHSTPPIPPRVHRVVPRSKCIELDMNVDSAMKMIVTLGVVGPGAAAHPHAHPHPEGHPAASSGATDPRS